MTTQHPTITAYRLQHPFDKAVKLLREALARGELRTPLELDVSGRISRELGIDLVPCRLFGVDCPLLLLETLMINHSAAVLLPMHILLCGHGSHTMVHVFKPACLAGIDMTAEAAAPVIKLQIRVASVLEGIAVREDLCHSMP